MLYIFSPELGAIEVDSVEWNLFAPQWKAWLVISTQKIVDDISCIACYPNRTKSIRNMVKIILRLSVEYELHRRFSVNSKPLNAIT